MIGLSVSPDIRRKYFQLESGVGGRAIHAPLVVPEKTIGVSFQDEPLSQFGFFADWKVEPRWNLCDGPGGDNGGKVESVRKFLESGDKVLVCTHATFRFALKGLARKPSMIASVQWSSFINVSANPDNRLGDYVHQFVERNKTHLVAVRQLQRIDRSPPRRRRRRRLPAVRPTPHHAVAAIPAARRPLIVQPLTDHRGHASEEGQVRRDRLRLRPRHCQGEQRRQLLHEVPQLYSAVVVRVDVIDRAPE